MAYATTEQLESRWRLLTPDEKAIAETLLEDAAVILDTYTTNADPAILSIVSCNMVKRAMAPDAFGFNQPTVDGGTWDPYTPASGELMPDWKELKMLRSGSKVGFAKMECL